MAWEDPATFKQRRRIAQLAYQLGIDEAIEHEVKTKWDAHALICRLEKQANPKAKKVEKTPQLAMF